MIEILTGTYQVIDLQHWATGRPVELDMGCGKGRFALELAARYPDRLVLGSDVMLGRLRKMNRKAERRQLTNLVLLRANNLDLCAYLLPPASIDRIHLLCPDPWPKKRHRIKRLVTTDFLARIGRVLKSGGVLHMATDHFPYVEHWKRTLRLLPDFRKAPEAIQDVADLQTDFELQWAREGKQVPHLAYRFRGHT